ncbi:protein FAM186A-like [Ochotona princeps]|uniref:protein FAM186A-like n=1 Tax=Ochotona princeps TaxID=9978 RepID=UPI002714D67A|nr:protein FAM186A-like [Ochotona princeps]
MGSVEADESALEENGMNSPIKRTNSENTLDSPTVPGLEIPGPVQDIIYRIEQAQASRVREDTKTQMIDIMSNVHQIMTRYSVDFDLSLGRSSFLTERMKKQRTMFLERMATYAKSVESREKTLAYILAWLEEWNSILSEITAFDIDEHYHWIVQMEMFPDTLRAVENNVNILCSMSSTFLKEKKTQKKESVSRGALWKSWKDRLVKRPATAYALRPDQMIANQFATNSKVLEIQNMLQELTGTTIFNKLENTAIKYISSTILNLSKALSTVVEQVNIANIVGDSMFYEKYETEKELSRRMICDLSEQNEKLQQKLQDTQEKYEYLIRFKSITDQYASFPTSMTNIKTEDTEDSLDIILAKEFDNTLFKSPSKKIKAYETKWDSTLLYKAGMIPELPEEPDPQSEKKGTKASGPSKKPTGSKVGQRGDVYSYDMTGQYQPVKTEHTKGPRTQDHSGSNTSKEDSEGKLTEAQTNQYSELEEIEKGTEGIKTKTSSEPGIQHFPFSEAKSQHVKGRTSYKAEQARKFKTESPLRNRLNLSDLKESPIESANKLTRDLADPLSMAQVKQTSMSQKAEVKAKTQDIPLTTNRSKVGRRDHEESPTFSKQPKSPQLEKSRPNIQEDSSETKRALATPEVKGEESNTESFQKALMDFLKEKINNIDKPADENTMPRKESLLKRAEMENFETIKAKMDEYFQKMAEIVTQMVRKFKVAKNEGDVGEKPRMRKEAVSFMPVLHDEKSSTTTKSKISRFLSNENLDPVMKNVIEMILTEIESEGDAPKVSTVRKEHEKAKPKQDEYGQEGQDKMQDKSSLQKEAHMMTEAQKTTAKEQGMLFQREKEGKLNLDLKAEKHHQQKTRGRKEEEEEDKRKPREGAERLDRQREIAAGHQKTKGKKPEDKTKVTAGESQLPQGRTFPRVSGLPREITHSPPSTPSLSPRASTPEALHIYPQPLAEHKIHTPQLFQVTGVPLTHKQAPATKTSQQAKAQRTTLIPHQAQALAVTQIPQQAQALATTLTLQQAQMLGTTLTPQQDQMQGTTLTPQQAKALVTSLTPQQAQMLEKTLTYQQAQVLGTTLTSQESQALGTTLTPQQAQILGITSTTQEAKPLRILTSQQTQALGTTLTPQQAEALNITMILQQSQALGTTLAPHYTLSQGIHFNPEMVWDSHMALKQENNQAWLHPLTLEPDLTLTTPTAPQDTPAVKAAGTSEKIQTMQISSNMQQAWVFGVPSTEEHIELTQATGATPSPNLVQEMELPFTSMQAQSLGVSPTPEQLPISGTPPIPGQPLELEALSSRQLFLPKSPQTAWLPPVLEGPPTTRWPITSEMMSISAKIPSVWHPLTPGKSFPGELTESRPLTISGKPLEHQPASIDQSPSLPVRNTLGQQVTPLILPEDASPPRIPPTPGHPSRLWTPSATGMPQQGVLSSDKKKRWATTSTLKAQSLIQPSTPVVKTDQALFTINKIQLPEISDTPGEPQTPRDPSSMELLKAVEPHLTSDSPPGPQTPHANEAILHTLQKPRKSLPSLTPQLLITSQKPQWDQISWSPSIEKPWMIASCSDTNKDNMAGPPSPQELEGKTYFVDVSAQRKNLLLLNQALRTSELPSHLHMMARNLIIETLHTDAVRLGYLLHKYVAYRLIQRVRNNIIYQIKAIQYTGKGYETQKLYVMLSRIDDYQKKMMCTWTERQKFLEEKRNQCLRKMISLFSQLQEIYKLNLSQPIPLIINKKEMPAPTEFVQQTFQKLSIEEDRQSVKKIRCHVNQTNAIWKTDLSTSSYPIVEKTPINVPWDQLGGYPDIPRLLQLDVQSTFRKSLASIKTRIQKTPT